MYRIDYYDKDGKPKEAKNYMENHPEITFDKYALILYDSENYA